MECESCIEVFYNLIFSYILFSTEINTHAQTHFFLRSRFTKMQLTRHLWPIKLLYGVDKLHMSFCPPSTEQRHRITESLGCSLGTSECCLIQPPCSSRVTWSRVSRTVSGWFLNISKNGNPAPPWATSASTQLPPISEQIFPSAQRPPPTLWLVPFALCPVSGHCWNDALECAALHPPWSYLYTLAKSLLHLLFAKLKSQFPWSMLESEAACMPLNKPKPRKWFWPWNCNHAHCLAVNMLHDFLMVY